MFTQLEIFSVLFDGHHPRYHPTPSQSITRPWRWRRRCVPVISFHCHYIPCPDSTRSCFKSLLGPRVVFSLIPVVLYLFALSYIPLPEALSSSDIMTAALSRLIVFSTIVLGLLSGFGAISSSWQYLPFLFRAQ